MTIRFRCSCGHALEATDFQVGRRVSCPACGAKVKVAAADPFAPSARASPREPTRPLGAPKADEVKAIVARFKPEISDGNIYFAPDIPAKKLRNAVGSYAADGADEEPLVLIDNTAFGGAKAGALLTPRRLYAHNMLESPRGLALSEIRSVTFIEGLTSVLHLNDQKFLETNFPEKPAMRRFADMLRAIVDEFHPAHDPNAAVEALKALKELLDAGIITEAEFNARKQKHLDQI